MNQLPRNPPDFTDLAYLPGDTQNVPTDDELSAAGYLESQAVLATRTLRATNRARVEVPCTAPGCVNGTWYNMYGRPHGLCYTCKGKGTITRAANYEANKKARADRLARQAAEQAAQDLADAQRRIDSFKASKPDVAAWLAANRDSNSFAMSLCQAVERFGNLSVAQEAAVRRHLTPAQPVDQGATQDVDQLDISSLAGYYAVPDGDTRLKVRVHRPGKQSKYHGWLLVSDGAAYGQRKLYGKQCPGGFYQGAIKDVLRAILADPKAAQVAYGHLTGTCGVCGRLLEDEQSVAAGIGPICAAKFGG